MPTFCGLSEAFPEATAVAAFVTVADESGMFFLALSLSMFMRRTRKNKTNRTGVLDAIAA
jgi:hypothetical protein